MEKMKNNLKKVIAITLSVALVMTTVVTSAFMSVSASKSTITDDFSGAALNNSIWSNTSESNLPSLENGTLKLDATASAWNNNLTLFADANRNGKLIKTVSYKVKYGEEAGETVPSGIAESKLVLFWRTDISAPDANIAYIAPRASGKTFVNYMGTKENVTKPYGTNYLDGNSPAATNNSSVDTGEWVTFTLSYTYTDTGVTVAVSASDEQDNRASLNISANIALADQSKLTFGFSCAQNRALNCYIDDVSVEYHVSAEDEFIESHPILSKADAEISWEADKEALSTALADYEALEQENATIKAKLVEKYSAALNNFVYSGTVTTTTEFATYMQAKEIDDIVVSLGDASALKDLNPRLSVITDDFSNETISSYLWKTYKATDTVAEEAYTASVENGALLIPSTNDNNTGYKYITTINRALVNSQASLAKFEYTIDYSALGANKTAPRQFLSYNFDTYCVNGTNGVATGGKTAAAITAYASGVEWACFGQDKIPNIPNTTNLNPKKPVTVTVTYDHSGLTEDATPGYYSGTLKLDITLKYTLSTGSQATKAGYINAPINSLTLPQINAVGISATGGGNAYIDDVTIEYTYPRPSLLETQAEFISKVTTNKTIDRSSAEYQAFVSEYSLNTADDNEKLEQQATWNDFVVAAKVAFANGIDDNFEDKFYSDMKWSVLEEKKTGTYSSDKYVTATYDDGNTGIQPITGTAADYVLTIAKPNFNNVKYITFDYMPKAFADSVRIYPFYADNSVADTRTGLAIQFKNDKNSVYTATYWAQSGESTGKIGNQLINIARDKSMGILSDDSDVSKYTNIAYGRAFKVIVKYAFGEGNKLTLTTTILDNDGNKVASLSDSVTLVEGYSLENSYFAIRQNASGGNVIIDNIKTYSTVEAMDFNVKYANVLAYDVETLTPAEADDVAAMADDYALVTDKENVNENYAILTAASVQWNKSDIAGSFLAIHADALQSGATDEQVQNAWCVLNALDASAKAQLVIARQNLKEKLSSDSVANDTIKVSFVGDSQTAQAADRGENYSDFLMNIIKEKDTNNTYEHINLGVSGIRLTTANPGVSAHENQIHWQFNKVFAPDMIFLLIGSNDANVNAVGDNFTATLKRTVQLWQSLPSAPMVVLVSPYSNGYDNKNHTTNQTIAKNLPKVEAAMKQVQEETGCAFVDLYEYTNNLTSSEKEVIFKKDEIDAASGKEKLGYSDGLHPGSAGRMLAAEYIYDTLFTKTSIEFATDAIRSYDHEYADKYENYLGYSYYGLDDNVKASVKDMFTEEQKEELIKASVPKFGLKATGLDVKSFDGANGQLVYHVKYDYSALEAFGKEFTYGVIAVPQKALVDKSALTHTSEISSEYTSITILDIKGAGILSNNLYFRLLGSESEGFRGFKIAARAYICVDGEYLYSDDTVAQAVNGERRALANKMIDLTYNGYKTGALSYLDANGDAYFTGFAEAPTESTIAELLKYVSASDKTSYADTENVYAFLKDNYDVYIAG